MNIEDPQHNRHIIGGCAGQVSSNATSDTLFDRIKTWMNRCKEKHSVCALVDASAIRRLPKRVLDIGSASEEEVRLVEQGDTRHCEGEPYIALSHCWGKTQHITTTRNTLDQRKRGIPMPSMSRTFQDSITIARKLGVRYVWIDSLCIIQGDAKDWETEAAKMASIYNGAYLVVAATAMSDGSGGCLFTRKPEVTIDGISPTGKSFQIYGRPVINHEIFGWDVEKDWQRVWALVNTKSRLEREKSRYPLMTRAWCFQERMLATRMLHYTKHEVVFECASSMHCECGALQDYEQDPHLDARRVILTRSGRRAEQRATSHNQQGDDVIDHDIWRDFMVEFSQKQITKRTDCLPAIAGLAVKWHNPVLTGRYLAGIWEKDLLRSLAWVAHDFDSNQELPYIAPSWSWLSAQRGVTWGGTRLRDREYFVKIHHDQTACHPLSKDNPYGQVSSGCIFMTGRITPVKITKFAVSGEGVHLGKEGHPDLALFRLPDSMFRIRHLQNEELYCLRFCNFGIGKPMALEEDAAIVLARATPQDLARQPKHVREFGHVYVRLGITTHYLTEVWNHEAESKEVQLYLI